MSTTNLILALETGIKGGSVSIIENGEETSGWVGGSSLTGSEDVLLALEDMIETHGLDLGQIKKIAVSEGPGSYTGLRTGLSIAKGLETAFGARIQGVRLFDAMLKKAPIGTLAALPFGKREVSWQIKTSDAPNEGLHISNDINFCNQSDFAEVLKFNHPSNLLLTECFYKDLNITKSILKTTDVIFCDSNYARLIGLSVRVEDADEIVRIMYPKRVGSL